MVLDFFVADDILHRVSGDEGSIATKDNEALCIPNDSLEDLHCVPGFTNPSPPIILEELYLQPNSSNNGAATLKRQRRTSRGRRKRTNFETVLLHPAQSDRSDDRASRDGSSSEQQEAPKQSRRRRRRRRNRELPLHGSEEERTCMQCDTNVTPQWRAGPSGPGTLCNACGIRYSTGRLLPEYRPLGTLACENDENNYSNRHKDIIKIRMNKAL